MTRKPRADFNTSVHSIFESLDAGELPPVVEAKQAEQQAAAKEAAKDQSAVAKGRKGGPARQALLSADEKRELGQKAAAARWGKTKGAAS